MHSGSADLSPTTASEGNIMKISKVAAVTGMTAKMIRYYERIALIPTALRTDAGYREYTQQDVERLQFIAQARQLGFSLDEIKSLLQLQQDPQRHSADVKQLAEQHLKDLSGKIWQLQQMADQLQDLIACCAGDDHPQCAILEQLQSLGHDPLKSAQD
jgi:MerR family gold-responsive transcriptional activator of gol and ges genes